MTRPRVMGIVNVTPDSFSDGGRLASVEAAVAHGLRLVEQGTDILDIGGESTRPGAQPVEAAAEIARVVPVIEGLRARWPGPISIDFDSADDLTTGRFTITSRSQAKVQSNSTYTQVRRARAVRRRHARCPRRVGSF